MPPDLNFASLSRRQGALLLRLLERERPAISHQMLAEAGALDLLSRGVMNTQRFSGSVVLMEEDGPRAVELEWLPHKHAYGYFTPDGYVEPDPTVLQSYMLNMDWWLKWLAVELDLVDSAASFELVKGQAWDLGSRWVSRRTKVPVIFARRLKHQAIAKELIDVMTARAGRSGGLILTSSQRAPELAVWPHRFQLRTIANLLSQDLEEFGLDRDLINGVFSPSAIKRSGDRINWSPELHLLSIDGQEWTFRGPIQERIIQRLVETYQDGKRLPMSAILSQAGSLAPDFAKAFKNNPAWPKLRQHLKTDRGLCWIEI